MVAEFRFHGTDDVALLGIEDGILKGLRHHALAEERKVAALRGAARILRFLFGDCGKLRGIRLHFSENPLGLLQSGSLVVAELNEDVACAALLRDRPAVLVLLVISLDVLGIGFLILEILGRKDDVFGLDVLGREEFGKMSGVVSLHLIVRNVHGIQEISSVDRERAHLTFIRENLVHLLNERLRHRIGIGDAGDQHFLFKIALDLSNKLLVALALGAQELLIELGGEFSILLERIGILDESHRFSFAHHHVILRYRLRDGGVIHQHAQDVFTSLFVVKDVCTEAFAHLLTQTLKLLALRQVELFGSDLRLAHLDDGVVALAHAVVGVNAGNHKARDDQHHGNEHQPALVLAECLKHRGSFINSIFLSSSGAAMRSNRVDKVIDKKKGEPHGSPFLKNLWRSGRDSNPRPSA